MSNLKNENESQNEVSGSEPKTNLNETDEPLKEKQLKTFKAVDDYALTQEFKSLNQEKQDAILSLKNIKAQEMPKEINLRDFENLKEHFKNKDDKTQREYFLKLFDATIKEPDLILEVEKNGELRQEFIKAFKHKENKDLYYLSITKDTKEITGIPTTQIKKVINEIARSKKVIKARALEEITYLAKPLQKANNVPNSPSENLTQQNLKEVKPTLKPKKERII